MVSSTHSKRGCPQIVNHHRFGLQYRPHHLALGGQRSVVVTGLDALQQFLVVQEQDFGALFDEAFQQSHRQVVLPTPVSPISSRPFPSPSG